ncbi:MAG: ABC transporter substrate-binding protein [Beijerinckiaceae bacterium]|jgi:peptide/nickel transport system substrate-binding protein|nr:ABC transporter substrate-binding protein [Beijerinckiaceae bacterium]
MVAIHKTPKSGAMRHQIVLAVGAFAILAGAMGLAHAAGEIRVGFSQDAQTLDPGNHRNRETETIIRNLCDGILTRDPAMKVVPELAESIRQIDATTWEIKIRDGLKSHAGHPFTASDIKFNLDRLTKENALGGKTSPRQSLLGPLADSEVIDARTVRLKLSAPWAILPAMLPFQEMISEAHAKKVGDAALATSVDCVGPYKLVEWRRGDSVIMARDPGYYGGATAIPPVGPAKPDRVIFKIIPENSSRVAALLAGEVDIINELPPSAIKQVEASDRAQVMAVNGTRTFFVALNLAKKPFDDLRVRKALNHAVDRNLIIERILAGKATALNGVMSPDAFAFNDQLPAYAYDPALARKLLAEAGYPNGIELTIDTIGAFKSTAEAVAALLARSNIRAKVQVWEGAVLSPMWASAEKRAERDAYFNSWGNGALDPSDIMVPTLRTKGRGNFAGFSNARVDTLLDAAETEADQAKRAAMYKEAQAIVNAEAPWIFLWLPQDLYGVSKRLKGWRPSADARINLHDASVD